MKRLTKKETSVYGGIEYVLCEHTDEECNDWCMYKKCEWIENALKKLKAYEDAEEKGLLFKMPCKPGDVCYFPITDPNGADPSGIIERKVSKIILGKQHDQIVFTSKHSFTIWGKNWDEYFYKSIFLTREAAEKALQQIQEET